ncbi:MAG: mannosyltransferase [Frankiales bacterium]|jgi:mannosyltransferase|nr:mannosyltransferase [Frankiales bacterium]
MRALPPFLLLLLALPPLLRQPLWYDEVATRDASRRSLGQLWHLLQHTDAVFGCYYFLIHLLLAVGAAAWWLRLPSLLATVAAVVVVGRIGRHLLGERMGVLAAGLFAVNPFVLAYAHDARPYALALLGVTAAGSQLFVPRTTRGVALRWAGWATLAVAAHLFAVVSLLPQLWLLRSRVRGWSLAALVPLATAAAIASVTVTQRGQVGWLSRPAWYAVFAGWATLSGGWWVAALPAIGAVLAVRYRQARWGTVVAWAVVPLVVLLLASIVTPVYLPRYLVEVTPALALLSAVGVRSVLAIAARSTYSAGTVAVRSVGSVVAVVVTLVAVVQAQKPYQYENLPAAADFIRDSAAPGDGLVYLGDTARLALADALAADAARPLSKDGPVPVDVLLDPRTDAVSTGVLQATSISPPEAKPVLSRARRLWVASWAGAGAVPSADPTSLAVQDVLRDGWSTVAVQSFGSMRIALWQRSNRAGTVVTP